MEGDAAEGQQGTNASSTSDVGVSGYGRSLNTDRATITARWERPNALKRIYDDDASSAQPHPPVPEPPLALMDYIAKGAVGTPYTAVETGRALLAAMNTEEPFKLLSALPQRLEELCAIQSRQGSTEVC